VAIGFRSLINTYTELIKTVGIYEGLRKFYPNIHDDPVYNQPDFFKKYLSYIEIE
jgi:ABC-type long-subunit fatty acid transport system fused permease/ATPase subunit